MHEIILYSSHCALCSMVENLLKRYKIPHTIVDDEKQQMPIAEENNIKSMPFASVDGKVMTAQDLMAFIKSHGRV